MKIIDVVDCYGCGNCQAICSVQAVCLQLDKEGFWMPVVNSDICLKCGKCNTVCLASQDFTNNRTKFGLSSFYGHTADPEELKTCASGGVATAVAKEIIHRKGVVYGSAYSDNFQNVIMKCACTVEELSVFKGSKYVQSYKGCCFVSIKKDIDSGRIVLYIGLPCEVAALKAFLHGDRENLYTIDLICHGPTSMLGLKDYTREISGNKPDEIVEFTMRFKKKGIWSPYYISTHFNNGKQKLEPFWGSDFGFLFARFSRKSCYTCRFKGENDYADLTIGDAWGAAEDLLCKNGGGLSAIVVHSEKGLQLLNTTNALDITPARLDEIIKGNPNLVSGRTYSEERAYISAHLATDGLHNTVKKLKPIGRRIRDFLHIRKIQLIDKVNHEK